MKIQNENYEWEGKNFYGGHFFLAILISFTLAAFYYGWVSTEFGLILATVWAWVIWFNKYYNDSNIKHYKIERKEISKGEYDKNDLSKNLSKFFVEKIVDLVQIVAMLGILLFAVSYSFRYGNIVGSSVLVFILVAFYFISKFTSKLFNRWVVPYLYILERKKYLLVDTFYTLSLISVVIYFLYPYVDKALLFSVFGFLVLIKEIRKWNGFKNDKKASEFVEEVVEKRQEEIEKIIEQPPVVEAEIIKEEPNRPEIDEIAKEPKEEEKREV